MFGSSRTSTPRIAAMPAMMMSRFITVARIGRRTLSDGRSSVRGVRSDTARDLADRLARLHLHQSSRAQALHALDHDQVVARERRVHQHPLVLALEHPHLHALGLLPVDAPD